MGIRWTPDNDQKLLAATIPLQEAIDETEQDEEISEQTARLSRTSDQAENSLSTRIIAIRSLSRLLRHHKKSNESLIINSASDLESVQELCAKYLEEAGVPLQKRQREVRYMAGSLLNVKAAQFLKEMDPIERDLALEEYEQEEQEEFVELDTTFVSEERKEEVVTELKSLEDASISAGYNAIFDVPSRVLYACVAITRRLEYLLNDRLAQAENES